MTSGQASIALKKWPWYVALILMSLAVFFYSLSVAGVMPVKRLPLAEHVSVGLFLAVFIYEFTLDLRWKRTWALCGEPLIMVMRGMSQRGRLFYILGFLQLYGLVIGIAAAVYWSLFSVECSVTLLFGVSVVHGLFASARRLSPIPDEIQTDRKKMNEFGLEPLATDKDMTRTAVIAIGLGVLLTVFLCFKLLFEIARNRS